MPIQTYRPSISKTPNYGNLISDWPVNEGLVSRWLTLPLLKGRAKFTDIASINDGTFTGYGSGSPWRSAMGRQGGFGSVNFDGTDDYVDISSDIYGETGSIFMWVCPGFSATDSETIKRLWGFGVDTDSNGLELRYEFRNLGAVDDAWAVVCNDASNYMLYANGQTFSAGTWIHLGFTWDFTNDNYALYINGLQVSTSAASKTRPTLANSRLGAGISAASFPYNGLIDDVPVFNRALSSNEIYALYQDSRRGYPNSLNWLSGTKYFVGSGGTSTYTATIAATVGAVTAAASATFTKPTYTAAISGTTGPSSAAVTATFTKPTYTAAVVATAGHATAAVAATFAKPTYTAAISAATGPATAAVAATFAEMAYTAAISATTGHATGAVAATFAKPTYTATVQAASPPATASALVTFSADANVATIVAVAAPVVAQAYVTFTVSVPPGRFIVDQVSFADPVDSVEFSYPVDSVTF